MPIAAVLVVVGVVISFDRRDQAGTTRAATPARNTRTYAVGASARSGDFDITVFGVKDPQPPGEFLRPDVGKRLLSADVQVTNRSTGTQGFSSLLGFHLVDSETHEYDISFGEIQPPAPDGDIAPGESLRGFVVFEVPDAARGFRFRAAGSLTAAEVVFALA